MIRKAGRFLRNLWLRATDARRTTELAGERVVFKHLRAFGFLDGQEGRRILEIGPKHGKDSLLLATLNPSELVLIDLPEKASLVHEWFPQLSATCKALHVKANILSLTEEQYKQLGSFDLIWCLGVLYHNAEQLKLLKKLFDLCNLNGCVVIESATTRTRRLEKLNVVEIHWPSTYRNVQTITHLPSRQAIKSWMEMAGFTNVKIWGVYSREIGSQRAVLTGTKTCDSKPYTGYDTSGPSPAHVAGHPT
jgi:tRNA (mo5U34)-methyltransferase